jgi:hypothetical protein
MADPFATAAELSQLIGNTEPPDLSRMQLFLDLASAEIRGYTDQTLSEVVGDVVTVYPRASTLLTLPQRPVTAVSSVLVGGVATTDYYIVPRGLRSGTVASPGAAWMSGATVTYSHGYAETTEQYKQIKKICLEAASRAFTLNIQTMSSRTIGASQAMGNTLMESAGYAPQIFLSFSEKTALDRFKRGPVR